MQMRYRAALAAGFVGAVAMAAAAFGQTGTPAPSGSGTPAGRPDAKKFGMHHRVVHSESKVQTADGFATVIVDTGDVTSVDGNSVTIKRADNETVTVAAGADTKVRRNGEKATVSALKPGDHARILQVVEGGTTTVRSIHAGDESFKPQHRSGGRHRMRGELKGPADAPADAPGDAPAEEAGFFAA